MTQPVPVYIELDAGYDHDAIERDLDEQMGLTPKPKRERSWDCLAGEAPVGCEHIRITRSPVGNGMTAVSCACGHAWSEVES